MLNEKFIIPLRYAFIGDQLDIVHENEVCDIVFFAPCNDLHIAITEIGNVDFIVMIDQEWHKAVAIRFLDHKHAGTIVDLWIVDHFESGISVDKAQIMIVLIIQAVIQVMILASVPGSFSCSFVGMPPSASYTIISFVDFGT